MRKLSGRSCTLVAVVFCFLLIFSLNVWAIPSDKDDEDGPGPDPYTKEKPKALKKMGYERLGPFQITDTHGTEDVEKLIGAKWMVWVETEHFIIGSTLNPILLITAEPDAANRLKKEFARLRKKNPRIDKKPKELDEWLTLHLYAQRLEDLYADVFKRFGMTEERNGKYTEGCDEKDPFATYVGWRKKFIVLFFEQKCNLARYLARYTGIKRDSSYRHWFNKEKQMVFATSREDYMDWADLDTAFYAHVTSNMVRVFVNTYGGYKYTLPLWWGDGLNHWYVRNIDIQFYYPTTAKGQKQDYRRDHDWEKKVYARLKSKYFRPMEEVFVTFDPKELDFADHMMIWSRVDYLMTLDPAKTGKFMDTIKSLRWQAGMGDEDKLKAQRKALKEGWGMTPDELDKNWVAWALKRYKNFKRKKR